MIELIALARVDSLAGLAALPLRVKLLALASLVFVGELALRRFAARSTAYRRWTAFFAAVGAVWTAVLLSVVYALAARANVLGRRLVRDFRGRVALHAESVPAAPNAAPKRSAQVSDSNPMSP